MSDEIVIAYSFGKAGDMHVGDIQHAGEYPWINGISLNCNVLADLRLAPTGPVQIYVLHGNGRLPCFGVAGYKKLPRVQSVKCVAVIEADRILHDFALWCVEFWMGCLKSDRQKADIQEFIDRRRGRVAEGFVGYTPGYTYGVPISSAEKRYPNAIARACDQPSAILAAQTTQQKIDDLLPFGQTAEREVFFRAAEAKLISLIEEALP